MQLSEKDTAKKEKYFKTSYTPQTADCLPIFRPSSHTIFDYQSLQSTESPFQNFDYPSIVKLDLYLSFMKSSKININPIYRDLLVVFSVSLFLAVLIVSTVIVLFV